MVSRSLEGRWRAIIEFQQCRPRLWLPNYLVRTLQHRLRDRDPERFGGLEVDHELELSRLFDGQIGRLGALEDLVHESGRSPEHHGKARRIRHQASGLDVLPEA